MSEIKLRTIKSAYAEIKSMDPNTALTEWAVRQVVISGLIPSRRAGTKYLVNLSSVLDYFGAGDSNDCA